MTFTGALLWSLLLLLLGPMLGPSASAAAQSIVAGEVEGEVTDGLGDPVRGAAVSLVEERSGIARTVRTGGDGLFSFRFAPGGSYRVRVEALGYRPVVLTDVEVTSGDRIRIPVELVTEPPPVVRADTLRWGGAGAGGAGLGRRLGPVEVSSLPDRSRDVAALLATSSRADPEGGIEGLPVGFTTLIAEGEPFRPAVHPSLTSTGLPLGLLFPRIGLQSATVRTGLEDIEWSGSAGSVVSLETRSGLGRASAEAFGLWAGQPTWTNEILGTDGPAFTSAWGGGAASIPLIPDTALVAVAAEAGMVETPNIFWRNDFFTDRVLPDTPLPGIRSSRYGAGSARMDWLLESGVRITGRANFAAFQNESDRLGMPQSAYDTELPGEGVDGAVAAVVAAPISDRVLLEIRGSAGLSNRSWDEGTDSLPGAWLVRDRARLGVDPSYPASSDRLDLSLAPVVHFQSGANRVKGGARVTRGMFDVTHAEQAAGAYFFGSRDALQAGRGAAIRLADDAPSNDFATTRLTAFGQYRWSARPGLDVTTGVAWKRETLPTEDIRPVLEWIELTAFPNITPENTISGFDGRLHVRWDVSGDGGTWLVGGMGIEQGTFDPGAVHEALSLDGEVEVERVLGDGLDWEEREFPEDPEVGSRLALFGPELEAPRTTRAAGGLVQNLPGGIRFGVSAAFRRTEALLRRADLNRLLEPVGEDQDGRPIFGDLRIVSGTLFAEPESNRRFPGFEHVWALNADGWSEYVGVTASLDAPLGRSGSISLRYTWSETRDNWFGAADGGALGQLVPELPDPGWVESRSDFDVPHRLAALAALPLPLPWGGRVTGLYTLRSDRPFTARVATGLDANGDGSPFNDPAFIPAAGSEIEALAADWGCLSDRLGQLAERNGCRGDLLHSLDLRVSVGLPPIGGVAAAVTVDGLNLTDTDMGIRDDNLLILGGGSVDTDGDAIEVPYQVNPGFGQWLFRSDTGRMLRIGVQIGGIR